MDAINAIEKPSCTGYKVPSLDMAMDDHDDLRLNNDAEAVDLEVMRKARTLCKEFLGGAWSDLKHDQLRITPICGGLSNHLYLCRLPENRKSLGNEPQQVVLRIYGQILQENMSALLVDSVIFSLLSEKGLGPRLYGVFPGGRIEQFIPSRSLQTNELRVQHVSVEVARKMARFHSLNMPLSKRPSFMFDTMEKWCKEMNNMLASDGYDMTQYARLDEVEKMCIGEEIDFMRKVVDFIKSPVIFSHNDLQEGNILYCEHDKGEGGAGPNLMCIDFEYCSYNYRGFDLGNHFNEWCYNYTLEHYPFYTADNAAYPTRDEQLAFVRSYIEEWNRESGHEQIPADEKGEERLLREAQCLSLMSHLFWGLWSIVQIHKSSIQFGYLDYALERFNTYFDCKKNLPEDVLEAAK